MGGHGGEGGTQGGGVPCPVGRVMCGAMVGRSQRSLLLVFPWVAAGRARDVQLEPEGRSTGTRSQTFRSPMSLSFDHFSYSVNKIRNNYKKKT